MIYFLVLFMSFGCGGASGDRCASRAGRGYLATYTIASGEGCAVGGVGWTSYFTDDGDACEESTSGDHYSQHLTWAPDASGATGTVEIGRTDPPTPGPCPGTYSVTVVPMVVSP